MKLKVTGSCYDYTSRICKDMIHECQASDINSIGFVINKAAKAYEGIIPPDCYHQPYMTLDELEREMERMSFFSWQVHGKIIGVMGFQPIKDVALIRHAYVLPQYQRQGIGSHLLHHVKDMVTTRLLVGTWADAHWAIAFYKSHGFHLLPNKEELLQTYWNIPQRQIDTSVVLEIECIN